MRRRGGGPALLNSASPWASTSADLLSLYLSPFTGGVTTRTSLLPTPFPHDPRIHQHHLFSTSSVNTYGYSPSPLTSYLSWIREIVRGTGAPQTKPFIVSITGGADAVAAGVHEIATFAATHNLRLFAEINLSCPNIPGAPPPAYSAEGLGSYLQLLPEQMGVPVGIKLPPFTYPAQFDAVLDVVARYPAALSFITATNSLGGALHLSAPPSLSVDGGKRIWQPTLSSPAGTGVGGLAGEAIHWLAVGNVDSLRRGLDERGLGGVVVIGVGGVGDRDGMVRMLTVGAGAVGVATALGREGVEVFERILMGDAAVGEGEWCT
ncbi:hypothetical protein BZA05DRAFT_425600 [Tricharina praecox]|uniref:uncharacterized protein n=1 Tax=Tricharina praecox TaxID=43433 RepID=UPI00221F9F44|nr:uncharacterized protein BZA05DRAFT_425600 [Tricharina praecox]KAI5852385.1 hypothetical protein BZA05DRAFT_425600 [Tricharina praecox]